MRRRPWLVTSVLALSGLVAALSGTVMIPLVPVLPQELGVGAEDVSWLVTVTFLVGAVSIPTVSRLADIHGRRSMLLLCLATMAVGSVVTALADDFWLLIVGRGLAGLGVPLIPIAISVLRDVLPPDRVGTAVALVSATLGIGAAIGLPLAGLLYDGHGWRSAFWLIALVAVVLGLLVRTVVPAMVGYGGRFDLVGAVLLAVVTGAVMLVISNGGAWGWDSVLTTGLLGVGIVAAVLWALVETRAREPLVDLQTSITRPVLFTNLAALFIGFGMLINLLLAMQQLQAPVETGYGLGLTVLAASVLMVPGSLLMVVLAPLTGRLLDRYGGQLLLLSGAAIMAAGYAFRAVLSDDAVQIVIGCIVVGLGVSLAYAAMPTIIMSSVPTSMTAAANGLNALLRQVGTSASSSAVAAALATGSIVVGGVGYPSWQTFVLLNVLATAACVAAAVLAAWIPRRPVPR